MSQAESSTHWQTDVRRKHGNDDDGDHDHHDGIDDDADGADDAARPGRLCHKAQFSRKHQMEV